MNTRRPSSIEAQRQVRQATIDATRSPRERNRLGQFATPHPLAVEIARAAQQLVGRRHIRFADPSIGTGSFFSAALQVFGRRRIASACGIELDPVFATAAHDLWTASGLQIVNDDFTRIVANGSRPPAPDLILANPPYVRHHHLSRDDKRRLQQLVQERTGVRVSGLTGLYVHFLLLATDWMADDGVAAWLIPSEFMDVNYGAALKQFLTDRVTLVRAHRFDPDDVQFGDALVSSVVLLFRKAPPPSRHRVTFTRGGSFARPRISQRVSLKQLTATSKWTALPAQRVNGRRVHKPAAGPRLGDLFRIRRGIATGCNRFFILHRHDAVRRGLPPKYLRPILPSPRSLKPTVIEPDDDGYPQLEPQRCVIDCDLSEDLIAQRHPKLGAYLQSAVALDAQSSYLARHRQPWYRQEQREHAPFLCTYMGRGTDDRRPFRFIWNKSKAIATNLYLMLSPTGPLADMLRRHPSRAAKVHALLNDITADELRAAGRTYGGGLHKIEPRELSGVSAARFVSEWPELAQL